MPSLDLPCRNTSNCLEIHAEPMEPICSSLRLALSQPRSCLARTYCVQHGWRPLIGETDSLRLEDSRRLGEDPRRFYSRRPEALGTLLRGSKYPVFKDSGPKSRVWMLGPESLNIGYLDPLGWVCRSERARTVCSARG